MLHLLKNFARSILALPRDAGIFREKKSDTIEKWDWARQHGVFTVVVFYSEDCLASELMLRSAMAFEADLRNQCTTLYLSDRQPRARELATKLGVAKLPAVVFADAAGVARRSWGTLLNPLEVIAAVEQGVRQAKAQAAAVS